MDIVIPYKTPSHPPPQAEVVPVACPRVSASPLAIQLTEYSVFYHMSIKRDFIDMFYRHVDPIDI